MFRPGQIWHDVEGQPIQAHSAGMLYHQGTYYWFGENKNGPTCDGPMRRVDVIGISCYSSRDLYHWRHEGIVLPAQADDPAHDLHVSKVVERPKVIYNAGTRQFVMWMHIDSADYQYARAGVAVSATPTGPYRYLGSMRPCGAPCGDLTVFKDEDGTAYIVFASEWDRNMTIAQLDDEYLQPADLYIKTLVQPRSYQGREAPAVFKHDGLYILITSGCTGWEPNRAEYAVATSMLGAWETRGNPCVGPGADRTFDAQSTFVLPLADRANAYVFLADRWNSRDLGDSRYVWLPLRVDNGIVSIPWLDTWDLSYFDSSVRA